MTSGGSTDHEGFVRRPSPGNEPISLDILVLLGARVTLEAGERLWDQSPHALQAAAPRPVAALPHLSPPMALALSLFTGRSLPPSFLPLRWMFIYRSSIANCSMSHSVLFFVQIALHAHTYCNKSLVWFKISGF